MSRCPWRRMPWSDWIFSGGKCFLCCEKVATFLVDNFRRALLKCLHKVLPKYCEPPFHIIIMEQFQKVSTNWRDPFFTYVMNREECTAPIIRASFPTIPKPYFFGEKFYSLRKNHHHFGWPRWFGRPYIPPKTRMHCLKRTAHPCNWCLENDTSFTFGAKGLFSGPCCLVPGRVQGAVRCCSLFFCWINQNLTITYLYSL